MFNRLLKPPLTRSFFLFGARSTGKSTLLKELLPEKKAIWIDLLDPDVEFRLAQQPSRLAALLKQEASQSKSRKWVVIDEIQKVPSLLSMVHQFIRKGSFKFALTGSSARKLKRGNADLLAGRASWFELFPLTHKELKDQFHLEEILNWGSLPEIFKLSQEDRKRFLRSYASTYLKEEIVAEQLVRKIQPFRNFLELVALQNAQIINYSKFSKDCGVDVTTIQTYFEILQDTLVGIELPPFHLSVRKRQRQNSKFYFFDMGVTRALTGLLDYPISPRTPPYGKYFEQFIILEVFRFMRTFEKDWKLSYLTTKDGAEIDLIIDFNPTFRFAIEIKSTDRIDEKEVKEFERLAKDIPHVKLLFLSNDPDPQVYGKVQCLPWQKGLESLKF